MLPPQQQASTSGSAAMTSDGDPDRARVCSVKDLRDAFARIAGALRPEEVTCRALADHLRIDLDSTRTLQRIGYHLDALRLTAQFEVEALSPDDSPAGGDSLAGGDSPADSPDGYAGALLRIAQSWWMAYALQNSPKDQRSGAASLQAETRPEPGARLSVEAAYVARLIRKMMETKRKAVDGSER